MEFSEKLKQIRTGKGLKQADLADLLNISRQTVSKWESGNGYPEMGTLLALAKELDVSLDYLFFDAPTIELSQILAKPEIEEKMEDGPTSIGPDEICKAVANQLNVPIYQLTSKAYKSEVLAKARGYFLLLCRTYTQLSFNKMAKYIGYKDHVTVIYLLNKTVDMMKKDIVALTELKSICSALNLDFSCIQ